MKLREGFVSNSSSSSFVIEILEDVPKGSCPTCGRTYPNLMQLLETDRGGWSCSDTIIRENKRGIIKEHLSMAMDHQHNLDQLQGYKDSDRCPLTTWRKATVGESRKYSQEQIDNIKAFITEIENLTDDVYEIDVDYNDEEVYQAIKWMKKEGKLRIIRGEEELR